MMVTYQSTMVDPAAPLASVGTNLLAAGVATGATVTADEVKRRLRRRRVSTEIGDLATEFSEALETAIGEEQARLAAEEGTRALDPATDVDWGMIVEQLADDEATPDVDARQEREEIRVLFEDEADAVAQITTALCAVCEELGTAVEHTAELRQTVENAVGRAYRRAVTKFESRLANDDELAALFNAETDLELLERVNELQGRLAAIDGALGAQLSQAARDEGFARLSPTLFERLEPTGEAAWRTTFSLADVYAGVPAERTGHEDGHTASDELLAALRAGENRLVTGQPGGGKSTLCKQVALEWYRHPETGAVLYREYGRGGRAFESVGSLADTVEAATGHTLVVVEDAPREDANAIARFVADHADDPDVSVLLDARESELDGLDDDALDNAAGQRVHGRGLLNVPRYPLPAITVADIERAVAAFEASTGRRVRRDPTTLHDEVTGTTVEGFGAFLLLAFYFPAGESAERTGLEGHVRDRYRVLDPDTEYSPGESTPELTQYDDDLVADIGAMVALLSASGVGVYPELIAGLVVDDATDGWDALDRIDPVLDALSGWLLFEAPSTDGAPYVVHELWTALYLREHARDHKSSAESQRRAARSEPRIGRCLDALFRLCDTPERRDALSEVVPGSSIIDRLATDTESATAAIVESVFELGKRWPVLAPLFGTSASAQYELPETLADDKRRWVTNALGHAHLKRGAYDKARMEYKRRLQDAQEQNNRQSEAASLGNLGLIAQNVGEYDAAREYHQRSLAIDRDLGDRAGEAASLNNLGTIAESVGEYDAAREYHQRSLTIARDLDDRADEAKSLNNLGVVAEDVGEYDDAREYFQQSLAIERDLGDRSGEARCLGNLGLVAESVGEYDDAWEYHQRSLSIDRDLGNRSGEAKSLSNLGTVAQAVGKYEPAKKYHKRSLAIERDLGNRPGEARCLNNLGTVAKRVEEYDDAWEYLQQSLSIDRDLGNRSGEAKSLSNLGTVAQAVGKYETAKKYHQQSLVIERDIGNRRGEAASLRSLGLVAQEMGEYDAAKTYHQQGLAIRRDLGDRHGEAKTLAMLGEAAHKMSEYSDAREWCVAARDLFVDLGVVHHELTVRKSLVRTERAAGESAHARKRGEAALARLGGLEREFPDEREWFSNTLAELVDATDTGD